MSHPIPLASLQKQMTQMMEMMRVMSTRLEALEARSRPTQLATQSDILQEEEQCSTERIAETVSSSSDTTGLLSTVSHQPTQSATQPEHSVEQEEESLQQANAENTAEKPSDNKATVIKNTAQLSKIPRHMLSTLPRQTTTQQENDTTIWPAISACLGNITLWYITAMSTQEKDLLRRSQPNDYGQLGLFRTKFGRCIFGRIETVRCLVSTVISLFESFHCGRRTRGMHTTN